MPVLTPVPNPQRRPFKSAIVDAPCAVGTCMLHTFALFTCMLPQSESSLFCWKSSIHWDIFYPLLLVLLDCSSKTKTGTHIYMGSLGYIMHCPPIASVLCLLHLVSIRCRYKGQEYIYHFNFISIVSLTCRYKDRHNLIMPVSKV